MLFWTDGSPVSYQKWNTGIWGNMFPQSLTRIIPYKYFPYIRRWNLDHNPQFKMFLEWQRRGGKSSRISRLTRSANWTTMLSSTVELWRRASQTLQPKSSPQLASTVVFRLFQHSPVWVPCASVLRRLSIAGCVKETVIQ